MREIICGITSRTIAEVDVLRVGIMMSTTSPTINNTQSMGVGDVLCGVAE